MNHVIVISPDRKFIKIVPNSDLDSVKEFLDDRIENTFFLMEDSIIPETETHREIALKALEINEVIFLTTDNYQQYLMYIGDSRYENSKPNFSIQAHEIIIDKSIIPWNIIRRAIRTANGHFYKKN